MLFEDRFNSLIAAVVFLSTLGVVLQAHPSLCSQQGPTCPCLLSSPTAMATQQHPATASRHRPPSVTACEHPTTYILPHHNSTQHLPSICPPSFVFLTSFPWSSTHNRGHKQATAHSRFWHYFFILSSCSKRKHLTASKDFYLYCLKEIGPHVCFFPHSIFMTTY